MRREQVTGVILCGGRATRLGGIAKGLLEKDGVALIAQTSAALGEVAGARLLVADDPSPYADLGLDAIPDAVSGSGPAGGLLAALEHVATPFLIVVACDMPAIRAPVLELLRDRDEKFDVVVPAVGGIVEPLCARWAKRTAPHVRAALSRGVRKMSSLLDDLLVEDLPEALLRSADPGLELLGNVNTPEDARRLGVTGRRRQT